MREKHLNTLKELFFYTLVAEIYTFYTIIAIWTIRFVHYPQEFLVGVPFTPDEIEGLKASMPGDVWLYFSALVGAMTIAVFLFFLRSSLTIRRPPLTPERREKHRKLSRGLITLCLVALFANVILNFSALFGCISGKNFVFLLPILFILILYPQVWYHSHMSSKGIDTKIPIPLKAKVARSLVEIFTVCALIFGYVWVVGSMYYWIPSGLDIWWFSDTYIGKQGLLIGVLWMVFIVVCIGLDLRWTPYPPPKSQSVDSSLKREDAHG